MTDPTIRQLWNSGGCKWIHVFHVLGYPWAVCSDSALLSLVAYPEIYSDASYLRQKIFGTNSWSGNTPAHDAPIFPTLLTESSPGRPYHDKLSVSVEEGAGLPKIGTMRVRILDDDLGHTWDHASDDDTINGLEGVHRVADITESNLFGWGYLDENVTYTASAFDIEEESGTRLKDRIDGLDEDDYVVVWVNHEAIAISSTTGASNPYQLNVATEGRGLYKSRPQDHFSSFLSGIQATVSDVPGSIAGHFCELFMIPLDNDGALYHDGDDNPLIAREHEGVIAPNINTSNRVTTIQINPATSAIETNVSVAKAEKSICHLTNYVFCRGENSGTTLTGLQPYWQCPDLVIWELQEAPSQADNEWAAFKSSAMSLGEYAPEYWRQRTLWLCEQGETRTFETVEEIINALNTELSHLANYSDEQRTGRGTSGVNQKQQLIRPLQVYKAGEAVYIDYVNSDDTRIDIIGGTLRICGRITGRLCWILGIGQPDPNRSPTDRELSYKNIFQGDNRYFELLGNKLDNNAFNNQLNARELKYWKIFPDGFEHQKLGKISEYYYSWDWIGYPPEQFVGGDVTSGSTMDVFIPPEASWFRPPRYEGDEDTDPVKLYLRPDTDDNALLVGDQVNIGEFYTLTVDTFDDDDFFDAKKLITDGTISTKQNFTTFYGNSLIYPPRCGMNQKVNYDDYYSSLADVAADFWPDEYDVYIVKLRADLVTSELSDIYREFFGESASASLFIPRIIRLAHIPFFTTSGDFTSMIDWSSFESVVQPYVHGQYYAINADGEIDLLKSLNDELVFHMVTSTYEWSDTDNQHVIRFRKIGPALYNTAKLSGKHLTESSHTGEAPDESHSVKRMYNCIELVVDSVYTPMDTWTPEIDNEVDESTITIKNRTSTSPVHNDSTTLHIEPVFSRVSSDNLTSTAFQPWVDTLSYLSSPLITQELPITIAGRFLAEPGRESLLSHNTATVPFTHARGLANEPILVVRNSFGIWDGKGTISYRIGGRGAWTYGVAPAAKFDSGNYTLYGTYLIGVPNNHEYTISGAQPKDIFYFDCFDLADVDNPTARTSCECGNYAVAVVQHGIAPITGTCYVYDDGGTWTLRIDCVTTLIDDGQPLFVYYGKYDNLEICQQDWLILADQNGGIGTINKSACRWS
jgi:hypothetical protein